MLLNRRELAIQKVYEAAIEALKRQRQHGEMDDAAYLAGCKRLYGAYIRDLDNERAEEDAFFAENTWENGRLAL